MSQPNAMMFESPATLMRATALHAALLRDGAEIHAIHFWRARCSALIETLQQQMQDAKYPRANIDEVSLAQSILLDELTLRTLPHERRDEWLREPLQMRFHGLHDGAERVWKRIDALLAGSHQDHDALELYGVVLELGFDGGRADADACRQRVKSVLNRVARGHANQPTFVSTKTADNLVSVISSLPRTSHRPWSAKGLIVTIVAIIAIASLWIAFDVHLDAVVGRLSGASISQDGFAREARSP